MLVALGAFAACYASGVIATVFALVALVIIEGKIDPNDEWKQRY